MASHKRQRGARYQGINNKSKTKQWLGYREHTFAPFQNSLTPKESSLHVYEQELADTTGKKSARL